MNSAISTLGANVGAIRRAKVPRMPVKQLAARAGLSENIIRRIEGGFRSVNQGEMDRLAEALNISAGDLIATVRDDYEARAALDYWGKLFTIRHVDDLGGRFTVMPADNLVQARSEAEDTIGFLELAEGIQSDSDLVVELATPEEQALWVREAAGFMRQDDKSSGANEPLAERVANLRYAAFAFSED